MEPSLNLWTFIILLAAAHGILLSAVLFVHKRGNRTANIILGILIFVFSFRIVEVIAIWSKYIIEFPQLFSVTAPFKYLYGPLLFFYALALTEKLNFKTRDVFHFIPFVAHTWIFLPLFMAPYAFKVDLLTNVILVADPNGPIEINRFFLFAMFQIPHLLCYTWLTWRTLTHHRQQLNGSLQTLEKIKLDWLEKLLIGYGGLSALWLAYTIAIIFGANYLMELDYLVTGTICLMIYAIGYSTFKQPEIISDGLILKQLPKYERSTLTSGQASDYTAQLISLMETKQPYRNSDLKLTDLAKLLDISPHHLSQILNERLHQKFNDFVNGYRVNEAKQRLVDPDEHQTTVLEIAFDVGFNNKASFNTAFKKHTRQTPTQFRNSRHVISAGNNHLSP
ncbi:MAG: helix-turn-helix domain-containing protein [Calditrichia bacterium]